METALDHLQASLALAEPERYIRAYIDEGAAVMRLLHEAARRDIMPAYVSQLLAAFPRTNPAQRSREAVKSSPLLPEA